MKPVVVVDPPPVHVPLEPKEEPLTPVESRIFPDVELTQPKDESHSPSVHSQATSPSRSHEYELMNMPGSEDWSFVDANLDVAGQMRAQQCTSQSAFLAFLADTFSI